jgi:hypothetical protein
MSKHARRPSIASLALAACAAFWVDPSAAQRLPDAFFPESIAVASGGTLYVGSAVEGSIVRVRPGASSAEHFIAPGSNGLMSVQGLLVDEHARRLYACTGDLGVSKTAKTKGALLAFHLDTGAPMGRWPFPDDGFCNDIARTPGGSLLISDTFRPRILRFEPGTGQLTVWVEHPLLGGADFNGNGIAVDSNVVYLSTFADGRLLRVPVLPDESAGTPQAVALPRPLAGADAIRVLSPGVLLVFENDIPGGNGRVTRVDMSGAKASIVTILDGLKEPTSGVIAGERLIVVESQFRKLFGQDKGKPPQAFVLLSRRWLF